MNDDKSDYICIGGPTHGKQIRTKAEQLKLVVVNTDYNNLLTSGAIVLDTITNETSAGFEYRLFTYCGGCVWIPSVIPDSETISYIVKFATQPQRTNP